MIINTYRGLVIIITYLSYSTDNLQVSEHQHVICQLLNGVIEWAEDLVVQTGRDSRDSRHWEKLQRLSETPDTVRDSRDWVRHQRLLEAPETGRDSRDWERLQRLSETPETGRDCQRLSETPETVRDS